MNSLITRLITLILLCICLPAFASNVKGIYISSSTMEDTKEITYLIQRAKATGIDTFIVDFDRPSSTYQKNVAMLKKNNIHYVARIVVFPNGGTPDKVKSIDYREKKYQLVKNAIAYGAETIQLDYIRYNTSHGSSQQHVLDVYNVISWFRDRLQPQGIPLQVDVFGITSFGPEKHIGQDNTLIANAVDAICPMDYPSHFQPFAPHSAKPWHTVYNALASLKEQIKNHNTVKIIAWIEMSNYHYFLTKGARQKYIAAQIRAVDDSSITGWYAWSPSNYYDNLFEVLENGMEKTARRTME